MQQRAAPADGQFRVWRALLLHCIPFEAHNASLKVLVIISCWSAVSQMWAEERELDAGFAASFF
jgi:hypothetical protein